MVHCFLVILPRVGAGVKVSVLVSWQDSSSIIPGWTEKTQVTSFGSQKFSACISTATPLELW
jgi:hypothetical protein